MWRKRKRHPNPAVVHNRSIQIKKYSPRANVLRLGLEFVHSPNSKFHRSRKPHIEAPHRPSFLFFVKHGLVD
jgi:hypothetical protein